VRVGKSEVGQGDKLKGRRGKRAESCREVKERGMGMAEKAQGVGKESPAG
jgi:hypothetical protein